MPKSESCSANLPGVCMSLSVFRDNVSIVPLTSLIFSFLIKFPFLLLQQFETA